MTARSPEASQAASRRRSFRMCVLAALAALILVYLLLYGAGAFLIVSDPLKQADAVVPLGGGSAERVIEAVKIIQQYPRAMLILTEPGEVEPGEGSGSTFYWQVAVENGLSPHSILVTEGVQGSTRDEAVAVLHLMQAQQMKSVIVVTEPYHTRRARNIFRDVFKGSGLTVRVHSVSNHWYRPDTWFLSAEGWQMTLNEYIKLIGG